MTFNDQNYSYRYLGGFTKQVASHDQALDIYRLHKTRDISRSNPCILGFIKHEASHDQALNIYWLDKTLGIAQSSPHIFGFTKHVESHDQALKHFFNGMFHKTKISYYLYSHNILRQDDFSRAPYFT